MHDFTTAFLNFIILAVTAAPNAQAVSVDLEGNRWDTECQVAPELNPQGFGSKTLSFVFRDKSSAILVESRFEESSCNGAIIQTSRRYAKYTIAVEGESTKVSFVFDKANPKQRIQAEYRFHLTPGSEKAQLLNETYKTAGSVNQTLTPSSGETALKKVIVRQSVRSYVETQLLVLDRHLSDQALQQIRALTVFPALEAGKSLFVGPISPTKINTKVLDSFTAMNTAIFANPTEIELVSGGVPGNAQCLPHLKKISFDAQYAEYFKLLDSEASEQIDLTLAHELSHYLYELYIEKLSPVAKSPHGQLSGYRKLVDFSQEGIKNWPERLETSMAYANHHAEVDALGISVLILMGRDAQALKTALQKRSIRFRQDAGVDPELDLDLVSSLELPKFTDLIAREIQSAKVIEQY